MLAVDRVSSAQLRSELSGYLSAAVDDGEELLCASRTVCRASVGPGRIMVEGQATHVGSCYSLADDGRPLRILVVPKQVGGSLEHDKGRGEEHVTVEQRGAQVQTAKSGRRPHPRTNHMIGTGLALKVLLGLSVDGPETISLDGQQAHVFDCFAMANATLCSRVGADASGQGSSCMFEGCVTHLRRTIEILKPNVIVAQGWDKTGWSPSRAVAAVLRVPLPTKNTFVRADATRGTVAFVAGVHPSRHWFTTNMTAWKELEPAFRHARASALATGRQLPMVPEFPTTRCD
jgi:hypothetical protein